MGSANEGANEVGKTLYNGKVRGLILSNMPTIFYQQILYFKYIFRNMIMSSALILKKESLR